MENNCSEQTKEAVELLKKLIAAPSVSRDEKAAADVLEAYMKEKGLTPQRHGNNVWCASPPLIPPRGEEGGEEGDKAGKPLCANESSGLPWAPREKEGCWVMP